MWWNPKTWTMAQRHGFVNAEIRWPIFHEAYHRWWTLTMVMAHWPKIDHNPFLANAISNLRQIISKQINQSIKSNIFQFNWFFFRILSLFVFLFRFVNPIIWLNWHFAYAYNFNINRFFTVEKSNLSNLKEKFSPTFVNQFDPKYNQQSD